LTFRQQRRTAIALGTAALGALRWSRAAAAGNGPAAVPAAGPAAAAAPPAPAPGDALDLAAHLASGATSAAALVRASLRRIDRLDRRGPALCAVIERNPDAPAIAAARDGARAAGRALGPLDGVPVLLKDNIATGDRLRTSAGSLALADAPAARDAFLVARLRAAGAVILGKTNMSEWANIRSDRSSSGWSARGGLTRNPYALDRSASGSSSGSAVAVSAGYAPLAVGTETDGSVVSPAALCGIVGIKPTVGLVSRDGIVPISHSQDTAGAMATSVRGAAALLAAMAGRDEADPATAAAPPPEDYVAACRADGLAGARIGVVRAMFGRHPGVRACIEAAIDCMRAHGAVIVDPVELAPTRDYEDAELEVLLTELPGDLEHYLAAFAPAAPIRNLAQLVEWNRRHAAREMPYFGQELFERALTLGPIDGPSYRAARATCVRLARTEGIDATLQRHGLDALLAPTGDLAWLIDLVNGDSPGQSFSTPAAVAGYPHITVPAGLADGLPVGVSLVGRPYQESTLFRLAFAYEQASHARRPPGFAATAHVD
jgi:amidase